MGLQKVTLHWKEIILKVKTGSRGTSVGRASDLRSKDRRFEPCVCVRSTRKICESFSQSKALCWFAVGVPNPHVYTHAYSWSRCTHVKDPVVRVRVWWIMETRKDPACALISSVWVARLCCSWLSLRKVTQISNGRISQSLFYFLAVMTSRPQKHGWINWGVLVIVALLVLVLSQLDQMQSACIGIRSWSLCFQTGWMSQYS